MARTIYIHKEAGQRKDAVRVRSYDDIPDFLQGARTHKNADGSWSIQTD